MRVLLRAAALAIALLVPASALAQSSPGLIFGQVPTAAQWNSYFAAKQDVLGYTPVNRAGDTMQGELFVAASTAVRSGISLQVGVAPTTPTNGDLWTTSAGLYVRINGATVGPLNNAESVAITALTGDVTATGPGSVAATLATAQPGVHTWALAQTFTVAPVFTDQAGSRSALGLGMIFQVASNLPNGNQGTWLLQNATYDPVNDEFNRIDITKYTYALNMRTADLPFEVNDSGWTFWRAAPGANPIGTYAAIGGWELQLESNSFRNVVVGGCGVEIDGSGSVPYVRASNATAAGVKWRGFQTNSFCDLSGVDSASDPSWFFGVKDDLFVIARAAAGAGATPTTFFSVNTAGQTSIGAGSAITSSGPGGAMTSAAFTTASATSSASSLVLRDADQNAFANNFVSKATNNASGAGTTTLTSASARLQNFTGASTQTYKLPDATTLSIGATFQFNNNGGGVVTIVDNGSNTITTIPIGGMAVVSAIAVATANGSWDAHFTMPSNVVFGTAGLAITGTLSATGHVVLEGVTSTGATGTGNFVFSAAPTITGHPTIEGVTATGATGTGAFVFATSPSLVTPALGVATATSVAINGCTIGSDKFCTSGTTTISGTMVLGGSAGSSYITVDAFHDVFDTAGNSVNLGTTAFPWAKVATVGLEIAGHAIANSASTPSLTSCGGGSPAINGTDLAGVVTMGTSATGCVITFSTAYVAEPHCIVSWIATPLASQSYATSTTAITLTQTSTSSNKVKYICIARSGG